MCVYLNPIRQLRYIPINKHRLWSRIYFSENRTAEKNKYYIIKTPPRFCPIFTYTIAVYIILFRLNFYINIHFQATSYWPKFGRAQTSCYYIIWVPTYLYLPTYTVWYYFKYLFHKQSLLHIVQSQRAYLQYCEHYT